jgi:histidinol dehydrogenase
MRVITTRGKTPLQVAEELAAPAAAFATEQQAVVRGIVEDVRARGDAAVLEHTRRFDCPDMTAARLRVTAKEFAAARAEVGEEFLQAVGEAAAHVRAFHEKQVPQDWIDLRQPGVVLGQKFTPIARVGIHVPGFTASYPSTAIMTIVPAQAAGVEEIYVVTPARRDGTVHPATLATIGLLGVEGVYKVGGAQAIAALAYGTKRIPKVDKVIGPGSIWVTLAKMLVYGTVGIEGLYGPSEVVILADGSAEPRLLAADLLAQAEHNEDSPVILVTPVKAVAEAVQQELRAQLKRLPRQAMAAKAIEDYGGIAVTKSMEEAVEVVNELAAEHVQLCTAEPFALLSRIRNAGAIFVGQTSPVPLGDYVIGPSHSLPTGRTARFLSGIGTMDFLKRSSIIYTSTEAVREHAEVVRVLGKLEGLDGHVRAVEARLKRP